MSQPPEFLPEEPAGWRGKPKEDYDDNGPRRGCGSVAALALLFAVFVVLVGMVAMLIYDPNLIEKILDFPNFPQTQQALDLTAQANRQRATQFALESQQTQQALGTQGAELQEAGTQAANGARENARRSLELSASETAISNAQTATQDVFYLLLTATQSVSTASAPLTQQALEATAVQDASNHSLTATAAALSGQPIATPTPRP